jgi:hypothetical protein
MVMTNLFLKGCKSEFEQFNEQALASASDDNQIDLKEFTELVNLIKQSDERGFQQFKEESGKIDSSKVVSYLLKYFSAKKLTITEADIWQPKNVAAIPEAININVFLENSGSMNGYLNDPNTQFKNSVYSLLTRLKLFVNQDSLNLFFINKEDQLLFGNASNNDVEAFKDILDPTSFSKISKGKTGETDINQLIKRCISKVNAKNMSVFISDCIYSPGKSRPDAKLYLSEQKHGIYLNFATEIRDRNSNLSVIILHLKGGFKGTYYDRLNNKIVFDNLIERPFYIWFIGTKTQIEKVVQSKLLEELDGSYINKTIFQPAINEVVRYKIMSNPLHGTFDRKNLVNNVIEKPTKSKGNQNLGLFGFTIAVDFSKGIQDASYYLDTSNYNVSNGTYKLVIEEIKDKSNPNLSGFTHLLKLQTNEIREEVLKIELIGKAPSWIYDYTSDDDSRILIDKSEQQKTFGLKYLVEGVSEAFYPKSNLNSIYTISITIKK